MNSCTVNTSKHNYFKFAIAFIPGQLCSRMQGGVWRLPVHMQRRLRRRQVSEVSVDDVLHIAQFGM